MKFQGASIKPIYGVILLICAVALLYMGRLSAPLVFDDGNYLDEATAQIKSDVTPVFGLRVLTIASFVLTQQLLGPDLAGHRLVNVLLHAANAVALFFLLRRIFTVTLLQGEARREISPMLAWFAFFGALLFALHPVGVYAVAYLIQRSTLLATLFVLLMLLAYLEGLLRGAWYWMLAAVMFYFAAVFSKEHSIAAPGVALALTFLVKKPSAAQLKKFVPFAVLLAIAAALVIYFAIVQGRLGLAYEPNASGLLEMSAKRQGLTDLPNALVLSILTQAFLFFKYLWLWLVPNPGWMSVDMREPFASSLLSWPHTAGFAAFLAYPCVAIWLLLKQGRRGLLGFAMLFPWILFLTELSTVRIQEPFVLYRSYLWMPGLFMALPVLFGWLAPRKVFVLLGAVCLLLIPLTLNRLNTFSDSISLWDDAEKLVRDKKNVFGVERIYYNRGTELGQLRRYSDAIADLDKAIATNPYIELAYGNRATAYFLLGNYAAALKDYNRAISLNPGNANNYYNRAQIYRALGNFMAAQEDARRSCALGLCPQY